MYIVSNKHEKEVCFDELLFMTFHAEVYRQSNNNWHFLYIIFLLSLSLSLSLSLFISLSFSLSLSVSRFQIIGNVLTRNCNRTYQIEGKQNQSNCLGKLEPKFCNQNFV